MMDGVAGFILHEKPISAAGALERSGVIGGVAGYRLAETVMTVPG